MGSRVGGKVNVLNEKKFDFLCIRNFKLLGQMKGSVNCYFLKFIIPVRCGRCDYSPWMPKSIAMPLMVMLFYDFL
jgi:hypothetical protein